MEISSNVCECPDVSADERATHQLIKRILKLRWMGMEQEAERIASMLHEAGPEVTSLAGPFDTD
jgi:hypothetical protein